MNRMSKRRAMALWAVAAKGLQALDRRKPTPALERQQLAASQGMELLAKQYAFTEEDVKTAGFTY